MIVYTYVHQDNCIHSLTFGAFELPNIVSFFSHMCWLGPEVSDASLAFQMNVCFPPIGSTAEEMLLQT